MGIRIPQSYGCPCHHISNKDSCMFHQYELIVLTFPKIFLIEELASNLCINNQGWVAGSARKDDQNVAFLYDGSLVQTITTLSTASAIVQAINDAGHIVGHIVDESENKARMRSFVLHEEYLDILKDDGMIPNYAVDVNKWGHALVLYDGWQSFIYKQKELYPLDPTDAYRLQAKSINDSGTVVGAGYLQGQRPRSGGAFLWDNNSVSFLPKLELGSVEKRISVANDINNAGQIVGISGSVGGPRHAFFYNDGEVHDLGTVGTWWSNALAMNNNGDIVGYTSQPHESMSHSQALLWHDQTLINLNDYAIGTGWELKKAIDINDKGQIVGWGILDDVMRIFLMNPVV